jgi:hypothetical protein
LQSNENFVNHPANVPVKLCDGLRVSPINVRISVLSFKFSPPYDLLELASNMGLSFNEFQKAVPQLHYHFAGILAH